MRKNWLILLGPILVAAGPSPVGQYRLVGVQDAAMALELKADGRFGYMLIYGALDQYAEGTWRQEGEEIRLTTQPEPQPPLFSLEASGRSSGGVKALLLENMNGQPIAHIDVAITLKSGETIESQTRGDWLEFEEEGALCPVSIRFSIPVYDVTSPLFAVNCKTADRWRFRLDPRDIAVRDFRDEAFRLEKDALIPAGFPAGARLEREGRPER